MNFDNELMFTPLGERSPKFAKTKMSSSCDTSIDEDVDRRMERLKPFVLLNGKFKEVEVSLAKGVIGKLKKKQATTKSPTTTTTSHVLFDTHHRSVLVLLISL